MARHLRRRATRLRNEGGKGSGELRRIPEEEAEKMERLAAEHPETRVPEGGHDQVTSPELATPAQTAERREHGDDAVPRPTEGGPQASAQATAGSDVAGDTESTGRSPSQ